MAVERPRNIRKSSPLDATSLEQAALNYVGRYATTRATLSAYLRRKVRERGWVGEGEPPVDLVAARIAELGYVDDAAFALARADSLARRGYGERRLREALHAAGVSEEDAAPARERSRRSAYDAALRLARRRGLGPFAAEPGDRATRERALGILLRAGHPADLARRFAEARPGEIPEPDEP